MADLQAFHPVALSVKDRDASARWYMDTLGLIELFEMEKAFYEIRYELDNRPDWVDIPLLGIARLCGMS